MPSKDDSYLDKQKKDKEFDYLYDVKKSKGSSIDVLNDLIDKCKKAKPVLVEPLEKLLSNYVHHRECYYYNGIPRGNYKIKGNPFDKVLTSDQEKLVEEYIGPELFGKMTTELRQLRNHLNKACTEKDMTVYRGIPYETLVKLMSKKGIAFPEYTKKSWSNEDTQIKVQEALKAVEKNKPILTDPAFTSTTIDTCVARCLGGEVLLEIFVPKGTRGGIVVNDVLGSHKYEMEQEILFPTNTKLQYIKGYSTSEKTKRGKVSFLLSFDVKLVKA